MFWLPLTSSNLPSFSHPSSYHFAPPNLVTLVRSRLTLQVV